MDDDPPFAIIRLRDKTMRAHPEPVIGDLAVRPARLLAMQRRAARPTTRRAVWLFAAGGVAILIALTLPDPTSRPGASTEGSVRTYAQWEASADQWPLQGRRLSPPDPHLISDATARLRQARRACFRGLQEACVEYRRIVLSRRSVPPRCAPPIAIK
jgi:hypothetical protein